MFGNFSLTLLSKETASYDIKIRKLVLENTKLPDVPGRLLVHIQYSAWPDFGLPTAGTQGFRECIHLVRTLSLVILPFICACAWIGMYVDVQMFA